MADQSLARYVNELSALTLLRTRGPSSRAEIARKLSVTPATVTRLVSQLTSRGFVHEIKRPADHSQLREPGRPGVSVALNPTGAYFLGVEVGVGVIRFAVLDLCGSITETATVRVARELTPQRAAELVAAKVAKLRALPQYRDKLLSVGVTLPGLVAMDGSVIHLPMLGWKNLRFTDFLRARFDLPCVVENNANAAAFGSVYTEFSLPSVSTIFLKLGTGCGGAAIINGRLLRGGVGTAGELGHIRVTATGHICSCGQRGCLETWVNLAALARSFRGTDALDLVSYEELPQQVVEADKADDPKAAAAIASLTKHLGRAIVTLVNIFNPTLIVLGGTMRPVLDRCLPKLRQQVEDGIVPGTLVPELRLSSLGEFECAVGAACLAHHRAFDLSNVDLAESDAAMAMSA